jgi:nicotinate-nucleotide--dimethylbenzimidazole phosphoribosyltransferase
VVFDGLVPPSGARLADVRHHLDTLTKPPGSLGGLESIAARLACIVGDPPAPLANKVICVLAADHGVAAEGVSAYPSEVTAQMCRNYVSGGAAVNAIAGVVGARVVVVDVGVNADLADVPGLVHRKVRRGTRNMTRESALTPDDVLVALDVGRELLDRELADADLIGLGEMGIGNTTAASALTVGLIGAPLDQVVGRGTGIDEAGLERKRHAVRTALERCADRDPLVLLTKVGGLEIAAMVGLIIEAARRHRPVVVDGFITGAAAVVADALCPPIRHYLFASHLSAEPGHRVQLEHLQLKPAIHLDMRLGEGTGAALMFPILDAAGSLLRNMATFESAGVSGRVGE